MVYVGKIYPVVAPSECHGGDTVSEIVVSIFIRLDLRTVSHTVSRTVSLYHGVKGVIQRFHTPTIYHPWELKRVLLGAGSTYGRLMEG